MTDNQGRGRAKRVPNFFGATTFGGTRRARGGASSGCERGGKEPTCNLAPIPFLTKAASFVISLKGSLLHLLPCSGLARVRARLSVGRDGEENDEEELAQVALRKEEL